MKKVEVEIKERNYPIYIGKNILSDFEIVFNRHVQSTQIAIISCEKVFMLYGEQFKSNLPSNCQIIELVIPDGEQSKSNKYLQDLYTKLLENRFERKSTVIALGGGVVGDLAGFVAATYLRGINLVQVPTTLLAQVDSSIGGKTGINHPLGKNLIGAFKQPDFVFSDVEFLKTLPSDEIRCGLGEVIKYAFIRDSKLFEFLESNLDAALSGNPEVLKHLVTVSSAQKADVVAADEKEGGLRMILNFGHTFGHALEAELGYGKLKHGEAVILGMKCALKYSQSLNILSQQQFNRGMDLLSRVPIKYDKEQLDIDKLVERMYLDKKVSDQNIRLILLDAIGSAIIKDKSDINLIKETFKLLKN